MSEKMRNTAFGLGEQANLHVDQLLRMFGDEKLFGNIAFQAVANLKKKIDDRLTDSLVMEYTMGFDAVASNPEPHRGMKLLEQLRRNQNRMVDQVDGWALLTYAALARFISLSSSRSSPSS